VTLPISSAAEMNQLTRFGIMAEALRQHQATNIDELLAGQQRLQAVLDSIDDGLLMIDRKAAWSTSTRSHSANWAGMKIVSARDWARHWCVRSWTNNCDWCCVAATWNGRPMTWKWKSRANCAC
jgi:sensor histidine kinase regulating citrate/malate metabolism